MTTVLVATASKHGATEEIGAAIAHVLAARGIESTQALAASAATLDGYDAVVLGSAVYAGHWMSEAKAFVDRFENELRHRPVWLFSSGPLGSPAMPIGDVQEVEPVSRRIGPGPPGVRWPPRQDPARNGGATGGLRGSGSVR